MALSECGRCRHITRLDDLLDETLLDADVLVCPACGSQRDMKPLRKAFKPLFDMREKYRDLRLARSRATQ